jgi:hypothetical protein
MKDFVSWLGRQGRSPAEIMLLQAHGRSVDLRQFPSLYRTIHSTTFNISTQCRCSPTDRPSVSRAACWPSDRRRLRSAQELCSGGSLLKLGHASACVDPSASTCILISPYRSSKGPQKQPSAKYSSCALLTKTRASGQKAYGFFCLNCISTISACSLSILNTVCRNRWLVPNTSLISEAERHLSGSRTGSTFSSNLRGM